MRKSKKLLAVLLSLCMMLSVCAIPAAAAGGAANVSFTVNESEVQIGDTFTVVINHGAATLEAAGVTLYFDKELLECTAVQGGLMEGQMFGLSASMYGMAIPTPANVVDSLADPEEGDNINADGNFAFGVLGTKGGSQFMETTVATLTFRAKAAGTAEISVKENSGGADGYVGVIDTKSIVITVPAVPATGISLNKTSLELVAGGAETLTATVEPANTTDTVAWTSSNEAVATVDSNGKVTAVAEGTATITATAGSKSATCAVSVSCAHTGGTATCAAKAVCTICGKEYGEKNPANHTGETEIKNAATASCKDDGYTGDTYCKGCGVKLATGEPIPATGAHIDADSKWESDGTNHYHTCACGTKFDTTACSGGTATCVAKAICGVCGNEYGEKNAANHTGETVVKGAVTASCKDNGYTGDTYCKGCDVKLADGEVILATGAHIDADSKWESDGVDHYHTCSCGTKFDTAACSGGTATCAAKAICSVCGNEYGEKNAANHTGETVIKGAVTASCKDNGYTGDTYCKGCDVKLADGEVILATGAHIDADSKWESDTENHWHTCACGTKIDVTAHTLIEVAEAAYLKSEANCSSKAIYYKSCSVCKVAGTETFESGEKDATAHDFVDGVCSHNDKHVQFDKEPGAKVEDVIEGLVSANITVKQMVEGTLTNVADLTTLFKDGAISVAEGKLTYELLPAAPEGEYYVEIGEYVVMIVVEKADTDYDRPSRPTLSNDAVKKVIAMIDELPSAKKVTLNDQKDVEAARKAYDALSKANQAKVTNYEDLVEVEEALKALLATPEMPEINNPFVDVADDVYYTDAVLWAVENNITSGTGADTFSPNAICTRAQVVTFLWRAAGSPAPKSTEMPFADVEAGAYYAAAVQWAVENNITGGTSATTFDPNGECTRGQIVTFLWRAEGYPAAAAVNAFADVAADAYYNAPVLWAVANGITNGTSATTFSPADSCTRAQVVTFLYRAMAK